MASNTPLSVKLNNLTSWISNWSIYQSGKMKQDIFPSVIVEAFQIGYYMYYRKYIDGKKGGTGGVSMILITYVLLNYYATYKELKCEQRQKYQ
uniref:ATP synthase F(0) complex subunit f, mitochondrial n=1 Tax=Vombatus ursinus TaxID=29139 RepID=A0A4X2K5H7_VOMUR